MKLKKIFLSIFLILSINESFFLFKNNIYLIKSKINQNIQINNIDWPDYNDYINVNFHVIPSMKFYGIVMQTSINVINLDYYIADINFCYFENNDTSIVNNHFFAIELSDPSNLDLKNFNENIYVPYNNKYLNQMNSDVGEIESGLEIQFHKNLNDFLLENENLTYDLTMDLIGKSQNDLVTLQIKQPSDEKNSKLNETDSSKYYRSDINEIKSEYINDQSNDKYGWFKNEIIVENDFLDKINIDNIHFYRGRGNNPEEIDPFDPVNGVKIDFTQNLDGSWKYLFYLKPYSFSKNYFKITGEFIYQQAPNNVFVPPLNFEKSWEVIHPEWFANYTLKIINWIVIIMSILLILLILSLLIKKNY